MPEFAKIKKIVQKKSLKPKFFDLLNIQQIYKVSKKNNKIKKISIKQQYQNLKYFIEDYKAELDNFISDDIHENHFPNHFNDKAATIVVACNNQQHCEKFGNFDFEQSLINSLKENFKKAKNGHKNIIQKVYLITKLEKHTFPDENAFLQSLDNSLGVIIQKGFRKSFLIPDDWKKYKTKIDFVKNLKTQAGFSPDYWDESINIFYFKAVEI